MTTLKENPWPCILFTTDFKGNIVGDLSGALPSIFAKPPQVIQELICPVDLLELRSHFQEERSPIVLSRVRFPYQDGEEIRTVWYDLRSRLGDDDQLYFAAFDIDNRVRAEAKTRASLEEERLQNAERALLVSRAERVKNQFLSNMSHELRTPLTAVLGLSEALALGLYGNCTPDQQEAITTINDCGKNLLRLINDILDVTMLEAGRVSLNPERINSTELWTSVFQLHKKTALQAQVALSLGPEHQDFWFIGDRKRLKQVLANLLSNAIKFGQQPGEVLAQSVEDEDRFIFECLDRGAGLPLSQLEILSQAFTQGTDGLDRLHGGMGLGLSLVKKLTALMGGWFSMAERDGGGTVASVALPAESSEAEPPKEAREFPPGSGLILLLEDHEPTARMISFALESWGYKTLKYRTKADLVTKGVPDGTKLILTDGRLADASGLDCIDWLSTQEIARKVPIVYLTASDAKEAKRAAIEAGASAYLEKPLELTLLQECVATLVNL